MKKIIKLFFAFLLINILVACKTVEVTSIEISKYGKDIYQVDESFDPTGYEVRINYSDGTNKTISLTVEMCDLSAIAGVGKNEINVTYSEGGKTVETSFEVIIEESIKENEVKPVSISMITEGTNIYCNLVELDLSGYLFLVTYSDNTTKEVVLDNSCADVTTFEEVDNDTLQTINIRYVENGVTVKTTIEVTVMNEWDYEDYIEELEILELIKQIEEDCKGIIPAATTTSLDLPDASDYGYKVKMVWMSSNPLVIAPNGEVELYEEDETVILTLSIYMIGEYDPIKEINYEVLVKGLGPVEMPEIKEGQKLVFAYFYEGTYTEISSSNASRIDVVNYCFGRVNNGVLDISGLTHLKEMMTFRREKQIRIVLSIGGGASGGFSKACSTAAGRTKFVESIMDVIKTYKFDGIDMDWEYPGWSGLGEGEYSSADPHNFSLLLKELRSAMDEYKEGLLLTAAVISSSADKFYEPTELDKYLDYVHIMTYDGNNTGIATHHTKPYGSGYSAENAINLFLNAGVRAEKIVIGAAFYGKISELTTPTTDYNSVVGKPVLSTKTIRYTTIYEDYLTNPEYRECFDATCGASYLTNGKFFITYDNVDSIQRKVDLVKKYGLGGMMFWDYGSDTTGSLLKAVYNGIHALNEN